MSVTRFLTVSVLLLSPVSLGAQKMTPSDPRSVFDLILPGDCVVVRRDGLPPDFEVYNVLCHGTPYAGIYVGNAPTPKNDARILETHRPQWPEFIQVWPDHVANDQERANRIAASVAVTRP